MGRVGGRRPDRSRGEKGRPGRHLVPQLPRVGRGAVRDGPDRRHPGQRQSRLPGDRAGVRAAPGRASAAWSAPPGTRRATTGPWWRRSGRGSTGSGTSSTSATPPGTPWRRAAEGVDRAEVAGDRRHPGLRRPHQHPVHLGDDGLPQGGHPLPPQHPQQRLLRGRAARLHRSRPGLPARALLSLLRHGDGESGGDHARVDHRHPGPVVRSGRHPGGRGRRAVHLAVRGADHVHRRARRRRLRRATTCRHSAPGSWPGRHARSR